MIQRVHLLLLTLAVVLGVVATITILHEINHWKSTYTRSHLVSVVVVKKSVATHQVIEPSDLQMKQVAQRDASPGVLTTTKNVVGQYAATSLIPGQQVVPQMITQQGSAAAFALKVPKGMRAITVSDSAVTGVDHLLSAGDRVDVIVTYQTQTQKTASTLLENIDVLYVDQRPQTSASTSTGAKPQTSGDTITLALTPKQVEQLTLAENIGKVKLTLRNPKDQQVKPVPAVNQHNFAH